MVDIALNGDHVRVIFLDNHIAIVSYKARRHWPGWRTAHINSLVAIFGYNS